MTDDTTVRRKGPGLLALLPLGLFLALAAVFFWQLRSGEDPSEIPSVLIGKPAPDFSLPPVEGLTAGGAQVQGFSRADLSGGVTLVNVFASWCVPCREEHPLLSSLASDSRFRILGLNYKDDPENAVRFLGALGNPYAAVGSDRSGRVGIDWGVYGVPETFVVDASGTIVYKHIGPLSPESIKEKLLPAVERALGSTAPAGS